MEAPPILSSFKGRPLSERLGFALCGLNRVVRRERSFRTQMVLAASAAAAAAVLRVEPVWWALLALSCGLVLALEAANAALEYAIDWLHPEIAAEIEAAKDAAAGAVLIASLGAASVGGLMVFAHLS
jgi:diacylglycerol kinase (ATP)